MVYLEWLLIILTPQQEVTIYIVTSQKNLSPAGSDPDIILRKSTDGGQTWSSGIRVNQDALNNGKYSIFSRYYCR